MSSMSVTMKLTWFRPGSLRVAAALPMPSEWWYGFGKQRMKAMKPST